MGSTTRWGSARVWVAVVSMLVACADDGSDSASGSTEGGTMVLEPAERAPTTEQASAPSSTSGSTSASTLAPEPTGVPGLDDADPLCASWAAYSGSLQVVGVAAAFGDLSSVDIATLELLAAVTVTGAIDGIADSWPAAVQGEYDVAIDELLGPYFRRAEKAIVALRDAAVTDAELAELGAAWLQALRTRDPAQPVVAVPELRPALLEKLQSAAVSFDAAVTPFAADPSLVVDGVETPATDAYLAEHCPELANSGVGDAV